MQVAQSVPRSCEGPRFVIRGELSPHQEGLPMSMDLALLDGSEQAALIRNREVTPLELVDAAIARIEKLNPQLNAVITPLFEKARAQAARGHIANGPFRGVPFLLKDLVCGSA